MLRLGVNIANFGPTATPRNLRDWVRFAEDNGFALAVMSDHVAPTPDVIAKYPPPFYDPFLTLSWLAGLTDRLELGTSVTILPYRHPLVTARAATNIDQLSGGRFVLGVGVGWSQPEFAALGVSFRERGRITDEYLRAITDAWSQDAVSFDGDHVRYRDVSTGPRSARPGHPPVWVGGMSQRAIRRAARFGDAWHPINPRLEWLRDTGLPVLQAAAAELGRTPPALCPRIKARLQRSEVPADDRPVGVGSAGQIQADLESLAELGATLVVLDTNPDHPSDRRPPEHDWHTLRAIADRARVAWGG